MLLRVLFILFCLILCAPSAQAAACLDVFPSGWRENTPANEQLINFPSNFSGATLTDGTTLPRGDNLYNNSNLGNKGEVYVSGLSGSETTARLFFRSSVSWQNVKINENGDPEDLIIVIDGGLQITGGSTVINAIIYVKGTTSVNGNSTINGAAATVGSSDLFNVNYDESYITNADFDGMCNNTPSEPTPITEYRFDETLYTGLPNEVIDSIGDFHGQAINSQPVEGKVCNAIDLSVTGTSDYAVLDKDILTGKTDFSISVWAKTSKTSNQSVLSGAGSFSSNELIMWFENHTSFRPYLYNSQNGIITTSSIADNNWQHFVWTKEGSQSCLFVDKTLKGCVTQETFQLDIQSLILGQEQDAVGGDFSSSQAFDGLLDEFLVFDSAITPDEIATIYDNQNAGLGYDGSIRNCPILPSPVLDLHFDENNWDATNSIIDISGNDYHANAVNVTPTEGFICNAADLSATGINDYLSLDHSAINGLKDFTLSAWVNTARTSAQTILSVANSNQSNEAVFYYENNTSSWPTLRESPFNTSTKTTVSNISTGSWKHHIWTRKTNVNNGELCLYIDNVIQGCSIHNNGEFAIDVDSTGFILGQEQDSLGGGFDSSQAFSGLLDEVLLFDKLLSVNDINNIYNNQVQGKNWDGTERSCGPVEPIAEWRMDELTWNGSTGEVIDQTGNFNGQSKNGADTAQSSPAIVGNPGTCAYGTFDGVNDYVALPTSFENQQGSFTITAWINPSNLQSGSRIFADDENNSRGYAFSLGDPGSGQLRFYSRGVSPVSVDTLSAVISADTWTFVTAVHNFDTKTREIYINGIAQTVTGGGTSNTYSGNWGVDTGIASIGGETDSGETGNRFTGSIDEVRMYDSALSAAEIEGVYRETHPCDSFIDHFEIDTLNGQGITCEADDIIIKACADASCNTVNPDAVDVKLFINNVENKTVTVSGNDGTSTSYSYTTVGNAALSLDQGYECKDSNNKPCIVDFKDSGFIISDIPMQISGKPSSEGFNATTLSLRAVETNTTTGACINTFPNDTDVAVNLSYSCAGGDCKDLLALSNNGNSYDLTETATPQDLHFSTDSTAIFTLNYPHAGKFIINAQKDVEVEDTDGNKLIKDFSVSSNAFVERPFGIKLGFSNDTNSTNALAQDASGVIDTDGSPFKKAGETFTLTATAMRWVSGQDVTGVSEVPDGIPDDFVVFNQNTLKAENFAGGEVSINNDLLLPNPGNNPVLNIIANNSFNASTSSLDNQYSFDEVGIIELKSTLASNDYLGAGDILGAVTNVGRFTPAYFIQTVAEHGRLNAYHYSTCDPITNDWAYAGQTRELGGLSVGAISYKELFAPIIHITAYNLKDGITQNYTESGFMKLLKAGIDITKPVADDETLRIEPIVTGEKVMLSSVMKRGKDPKETTTKGVVSYTFNESDDFVYEHTKYSKIAPFQAKIPFIVTRVEDGDNINLYVGSNTDITATQKVITEGVEIRFGRWYVENAFGPETSSLPTAMYVQYLKETEFEINTDDNCTVPDIEGEINSGAIWSGGLTAWQYRLLDASTDINEPITPDHTQAIAPDPLTAFSDGVYRKFIFSAPGDGNRGSLNFEYQVPPWLQYDWNNDESFTNNPTSTLTFGLYRGNDRIIYQREVLP